MYLAHRQERLEQVRRALQVLGDDATPRQVVEHVYADVDESCGRQPNPPSAPSWPTCAETELSGRGKWRACVSCDLAAIALGAPALESQMSTLLPLQADPAAVGEVGQRLVDRLPGSTDQLGDLLWVRPW